MNSKSYLSRQYRLLGITSSDLFTDEEVKQLNLIGDIGKELDKEGLSKEERKRITNRKKEESIKLRELFKQYPANTPRIVNPKKICSKINDEYPDHISLKRLKDRVIIQEFENEWSRVSNVNTNTFCLEKINLCWNEQHCDLLKQAFINGIDMVFEYPDGTIDTIHYKYFTASAGQMRTDRACFIEENNLKENWNQLFAGLTPKMIDAKGGINLNKISAYLGLVTGASERWELEDGSYLDIDNVIVVPDIESHVTCDMDHIDTEYKIERGTHEEKVNQCDGVGWVLPRLIEKSKVKSKNRMVRGPWIKGLVTQFDYIEFCKENNVEPVIVDFWKTPHNLLEENIMMVLTESQLKLAKYYDSWEQYKDMFHENNCYICATNYEEIVTDAKSIGQSCLNYQFLQTLLDITDEEIDSICKGDYDNIKALGTTKKSQLSALGCYKQKDKNWLQKSLLIYPEILRDGYCRQQIKEVKKSMILDAQSGKLNLYNKRLFAVPDPYAAWERLALGIAEPEGLIKPGEIWTADPGYKDIKTVDLLRSPHLYIEHCIRTLAKREELMKWFPTSAVYTSFKDIASRILQFDFDGDELNLLANNKVIAAAQRTIDNHSILPLFYDAQKAGKQTFTPDNRFDALMTAHQFGGAAIGNVSNTLTKLWNSIQDRDMAARICCMNNLIIDAAKTGKIIPYPDEIAKPINQLSHDKMPWFFQFTINGRQKDNKTIDDKKKKHKDKSKRELITEGYQSKPKDGDRTSVMNKIALKFDSLSREQIDINYDELNDFNPMMLLSRKPIINREIFIWFDQEINFAQNIMHEKKHTRMRMLEDIANVADGHIKDDVWWENKFKEIKEKAIKEFKDENIIYDTLVVLMFIEKPDAESRKEQFWAIYGDIAYKNIEYNLKNCHMCNKDDCHRLIPNWDKEHQHQIVDCTHLTCSICNKIFSFDRNRLYCPTCQQTQKERDKECRRRMKEKRKEERKKHVEEMEKLLHHG